MTEVEDTCETDASITSPTSRRFDIGSVGEVALATVAALVVAAALWRLFADSNRGIDLTDEGMYLLAADPPSPTDLFHAPFGRYTGILYRLMGYDIARFRAVGIVLLFTAATALGRNVAVVAGRLRGEAPSIAAQVLGAAAVAGGATTGYTLYLLTPNYNWINLVGLMLAAAGGLMLAVPAATPGRTDLLLWPTCVAAGAFISTTGKPSSGPVILALTSLLFLAVRTGPMIRRLVPVASTAGATFVIWLLHFVFVNSPSETADMYRRGLKALQILDPESYEVSNALRSVRAAVADLPQRVFEGTGGVVIAAFATCILVSRRSRSDEQTVAVLATGVMTASAVALALHGSWVGASPGYIVLATVGCSLVICAIPLAATAHVLQLRNGAWSGDAWWRLAVISFHLVLLAAAYAFGSGNGFWSQLNGSLGLLFACVVLMLMTCVDVPSRIPVAGIVAIAMALGGSHVLDTARDSPYRTAAMDAQTEPRSFGPHGSRLLLDPQTATYLDEFRGAVYDAGFVPGTPMLDLTYYSTSALYDIDALVPHSIIPTVGGYAATNDLARWSVGQLEPEVWGDAWLLTAPDSPSAPDPHVVSILGKTFPDDYELVAELEWWQRAEAQQIWRPKRD